MLGNFVNTKKQGDAGVGVAIAYFCVAGIPVSIPLTDSQDYDLVAELEGNLKKVQVKTTKQRRKTGFVVSLRVNGGNSKTNFVSKLGTEIVYDFLFVLDGEGGRYLIPKEVIADRRNSLVLGKKYRDFRV